MGGEGGATAALLSHSDATEHQAVQYIACDQALHSLSMRAIIITSMRPEG